MACNMDPEVDCWVMDRPVFAKNCDLIKGCSYANGHSLGHFNLKRRGNIKTQLNVFKSLHRTPEICFFHMTGTIQNQLSPSFIEGSFSHKTQNLPCE